MKICVLGNNIIISIYHFTKGDKNHEKANNQGNYFHFFYTYCNGNI